MCQIDDIDEKRKWKKHSFFNLTTPLYYIILLILKYLKIAINKFDKSQFQTRKFNNRANADLKESKPFTNYY
jgi:hypothetical protein